MRSADHGTFHAIPQQERVQSCRVTDLIFEVSLARFGRAFSCAARRVVVGRTRRFVNSVVRGIVPRAHTPTLDGCRLMQKGDAKVAFTSSNAFAALGSKGSKKKKSGKEKEDKSKKDKSTESQNAQGSSTSGTVAPEPAFPTAPIDWADDDDDDDFDAPPLPQWMQVSIVISARNVCTCRFSCAWPKLAQQ